MAFHTTSVALASSRPVHARGVARRSRLPESGPHANGAASRGCAISRPCPQLAADAFANRAVGSIPPILHRKELLLALDDPDRAAFAALTRDAEEAGLFRGSTTIGTRRRWEALLKQAGLAVQAHRLVPRRSLGDINVARHKTAIVRRGDVSANAGPSTTRAHQSEYNCPRLRVRSRRRPCRV